MVLTTRSVSSFTRSEIADLFKRARVALRYTGIRFLKAKSILPQGRLLIVTPRACGNAPERNLIRRRVKDIFRTQNLGAFGFDIVMIVSKDGIATPFETLKTLLAQAVNPQP